MNKRLITIFFIHLIVFSLKAQTLSESVSVTGKAKDYNATLDKKGSIHLVFTNENNLYYTFSENNGKSFGIPVLIDNGGVYRIVSPVIAVNDEGLLIVAAKNKDIYSWRKRITDKEWEKSVRVNDLERVATENLVSAASGKGNFNYAVWVDERQKGSFTIAGAYTIDGGMTWSKSSVLYKSPDGSICPCCKPSVAIHKDSVYIMFRNDLNGNRNMYLMMSDDEGINFKEPKKLGLGTWQINGCPVDGGGLVLNGKGWATIAWKRDKEIFFCEPDKPEQKAGMGRMCKISNSANGHWLIWQLDGNITVWSSKSKSINLGEGFKPDIIGSQNNQFVYAFWVDKADRLWLKQINTKQ